jgi:nitrate reductase gamma subunit
MVSGPIIVIGTALYLWRRRATSSLRRQVRSFQILLGVLVALAALRVWMWTATDGTGRELRSILFMWGLCLAYPLRELWRLRRGHGHDA